MSAIRAAETRAEIVPENEKEPPGQHDDDNFDNPDQREQLYLDVLHTISNTVGAPAPGGQVCTVHTKKNYIIYRCQFFFYFFFIGIYHHHNYILVVHYSDGDFYCFL